MKDVQYYSSCWIYLENSNHWHCESHTSCDVQTCSITVTLSNFIPNKKAIIKHIFKCCFSYNKQWGLRFEATSIIFRFADVDTAEGIAISTFLPLNSDRWGTRWNLSIKYCLWSVINWLFRWNCCFGNVCNDRVNSENKST